MRHRKSRHARAAAEAADDTESLPTPDDGDAWLWSVRGSVRTSRWLLRGAEDLRNGDDDDEPFELQRCRKPPSFSWLDAKSHRLTVRCDSEDAAWAAWPRDAAVGGGFRWRPLPPAPAAYDVDADVVVTRCGGEENWLQQIRPKLDVLERAERARLRRAGGAAPDVMLLFVDSVSRASFVRRFPRSSALLRRVNGSGWGEAFNFPLYHALPCCTKNWLYAALGGVYAPARNGVHEPALAARTDWLWDEFAAAGYATHVSNDVCYPSELQDWWGREECPHAPNISDHPLLDTFCKRKPGAAGGAAAHFQTRWDGVQYETALDDGEPICLAGEPLPRRWLDQALALLRAPAYARVPKFAYVALNDVHCRCARGAAHVDGEIERFVESLASLPRPPLLLLASDHGLLESFERPPADLNLPWLSIVAPRDLLRAVPAAAAALRGNQRRLVTPFDVHATLQHVARAAAGAPHPPSPDAAALARWREFREKFEANERATPLQYAQVPRSARPVGRSLLDELPERGCADAGIPQSACRLTPLGGGDGVGGWWRAATRGWVG